MRSIGSASWPEIVHHRTIANWAAGSRPWNQRAFNALIHICGGAERHTRGRTLASAFGARATVAVWFNMMRAITVTPGLADSARLEELPDPPVSEGSILVRALALGVCGTDREIISGEYGWAPPGQRRLVLGHESLGR